MDKRICLSMDKLPKPIIKRDKYGRFLKKTFAMKGRRYAYIFDYGSFAPRVLSKFERLKNKRKRVIEWRRRNKKEISAMSKRPKGLKGKNFEYSEIELDFIREKRIEGLSYQKVAVECNLRFYNGENIRKGNDIYAALKWRNEIPKKINTPLFSYTKPLEVLWDNLV